MKSEARTSARPIIAYALNGGGIRQNLHPAVTDIRDLAVDPISLRQQRFETARSVRFCFFSEIEDLLYDDGESALGDGGARSIECRNETDGSSGGPRQFVALLIRAWRKAAYQITLG